MARVITIKLTGLAERFIKEMEAQGLTEADVISQGIGLLEEVWRTNRIALVREDYWRKSQKASNDYGYEFIEHYFHVQTPKSMERLIGELNKNL